MNWIPRVQFYLLLTIIESSRAIVVDRNVVKKWYKFSCNGLPCTSELWPNSVVSCRIFDNPYKDLTESQLGNAYDVVTEVTKDSASVHVDPIVTVTALKTSSKLNYSQFDEIKSEINTAMDKDIVSSSKETTTSNVSTGYTTTSKVTSLESTGSLHRSHKEQNGWSGFVELEKRKRVPSLVVELNSGEDLHADELMRSVTGDHATVACINNPKEVKHPVESGMSLSELQTSHRMFFRLMRHDQLKDLKVVMAVRQDKVASSGVEYNISFPDFVFFYLNMILFLLNTL